jgi:enoyl-CoA hydratase/carnithine racemase
VSDEPLVVWRPAAGVVELRLNRPTRHNAVDTELLRRLRDELVALTDDRAVKAVVLTGEGPSFCAGADLAEFAGREAVDPADMLARVRLVIACMRGLLHLEPVTMAAVHGPAIGAGWGLALGCDLCWAADDAAFALPEVAKGYRIPRALVTRLAQVVGPVTAAEIVLSGVKVDVEAAMAMGAVTRRFPDAETLRREAIAFAAQLATLPRHVLAGAVDPLRTLAAPGASPELEYQWPEIRG